MAKKINEAAGYSPTSAAERDAVKIVRYLLNTKFCKDHFATDDKIPNTDGYIELTAEDQTPIGKIEVQIKKIKNSGKPKYQCDKSFLCYCDNSQLPVLLIGVDTISEKSYWLHISREYINGVSARLKGKSIAIHFNIDDQIESGSIVYYDKWVEIINAERQKLTDVVYLKEKNAELEGQIRTLAPYSRSSLGQSSKDYKEIHHFLDIYNRLLDTDFSVVKQVIYNNPWKIGFAYSFYKDNAIEYSLYPVGWETNDVQIKKLPATKEIWDEYSWIRMHAGNPIQNNPLSFSYEIIQRDLNEIFKSRAVLFFTNELAAEHVFDFVDCYHRELGYREGVNRYPVVELLNLIQEFRVSNRIDSTFNEEYLMNALFFLHSNRIETVRRPFSKRRSLFHMQAAEWKYYDADKLKILLTEYYSLFPKLYDSFIKCYFPSLINELGYFLKFDRQVILFESNKIYSGSSPIITVLGLRRIEGDFDDQVPLVINRDKEPSIFDGIYRMDLVEMQPLINGTRYLVISGSEGGHGFLFEYLPLYTQIYKMAEGKLKDYFEKFIKDDYSKI